MRLNDWAKQKGIAYRTAWEHFRTGKIPNAYQLSTGTIVVEEQSLQKPDWVVTYARVSSTENKQSLERQSERLVNFCSANGWLISQSIIEIGSGMNDNRKRLLSILQEGKATRLVVEHKDRLARFGVKYIECLCKHIGCDLVVINNSATDREDLVQDFISVITSFCARIYGQRRSKRKTEQIIRKLQDDKNESD